MSISINSLHLADISRIKWLQCSTKLRYVSWREFAFYYHRFSADGMQHLQSLCLFYIRYFTGSLVWRAENYTFMMRSNTCGYVTCGKCCTRVGAVTVAKGCDAISTGRTVYCKEQMVTTANVQRVNSSTFKMARFLWKKTVQSNSIKWNGWEDGKSYKPDPLKNRWR